MRFCLTCRHFSGGGPLCTHCGRSFGDRLCQGRTRHLNPLDALFCNHCGTTNLSEGATFIPLGWVSRLLILGALFFAGRWLLLSYNHTSNLRFQSLTGYRDARVWIIEKFANVFIILFIFDFFSSFMPGEAGKQFRSAVTSVLTHTIKLVFKLIEQTLGLVGKLLLKLLGLESESKKKKL